MVFELVYDYVPKKTDIGFDGIMVIHSDPFYLKYEINFEEKVENVVDGVLVKETMHKKITEKHTSRKPLKYIDGLLSDDKDLLKLEIKKGKIYIQDKLVEEYYK